MIRSAYIETRSIKILDIARTTPTQVVVVLKSGREFPLPRFHVDFMPGLAVVPLWLYQRIIQWEKDNANTDKQEHPAIA